MTNHVARVLIDACLLVKGNVSNVFFDLNHCGLISLHWTPELARQFVKNWSKMRVAADGISESSGTDAHYRKAFAEKEELAKDRLERFEAMQPEWRVPGWNLAKDSLWLPPARFKVGEAYGVHQGDYDVALAAAKLAKAFPKDEVWLATENQKHLPPQIMAKFDVWSINQGKALETLFDDWPDSVLGALLKMRGDSKTPKLSQQDFVNFVKAPGHFGMPALGDKIDKRWSDNDLAK